MIKTKLSISLWREDKLLIALVLGISFLNSWLWWVPVRCIMEGAEFEWSNNFGMGRLFGAGMGGHFLVLALLSGLFVSLVYLGWRGGRSPFKPLILLWCTATFLSSAFQTLSNPQGYRFRGDTLGININLAWYMPMLHGVLLLAAALWITLDYLRPRQRSIPSWGGMNTRCLFVAVALAPIQFLLLRHGPMHNATDVAGWIITYAQWVVINFAFIPWLQVPSSRELHPSCHFSKLNQEELPAQETTP